MSPKHFTPAVEKEIATLAGQLSDPNRSAQTRFEAARLLLGKTHIPAAQSALMQVLANTSLPASQIAIAEAITQTAQPSTAFIPALLNMLQGEEQSVRPSAARALVMYQFQGATDKLLPMAKNRKIDLDIRKIVIRDALAYIPAKSCISTLIGLLNSSPRIIQREALQALGHLTARYDRSPTMWKRWWQTAQSMKTEKWNQVVFAGLLRTNIQLERQNANLLEQLIKAKKDWFNASNELQRPDIVLSMLNDPISDVRLLGARLVDKLIAANAKLSFALQRRIRLLLVDADPRLRSKAAMLEASLADKHSCHRLLYQLRIEKQPQVRVSLLEALGQLGDPNALQAVVAELKNPIDEQVAAAAKALRRIVTNKPLKSKKQAKTALVLIDRYTKESKTPDEADIPVREALLESMAAVNDKSAQPVLLKALQDKSGIIRLAAVNGLSLMGIHEAAASIAPLTADTDRGVRQAAITALIKLGGMGYFKRILQRTNPEIESDPEVRHAAKQGIITLFQTADAKTLAESLKLLDEMEDALELKTILLKLYVKRQREAKSPTLMDDLRKLGLTLYKDKQAEEAVPVYAEVAQLAQQMPNSNTPAVRKKQQAIFREYLTIALAANDVATIKVLQAWAQWAQNTKSPTKKEDWASFQRGLRQFKDHLNALRRKKEYLPIITLAGTVIKEVNGRLSTQQKQQLQEMLQFARKSQLNLDRQAVKALLPKLLSADLDSRDEAMVKLTTMGDRAIQPLLEQLRGKVQAKTPAPKDEQAIFEAIKQLAPNMGEYDPASEKPQRLARINNWLAKITELTAPTTKP